MKKDARIQSRWYARRPVALVALGSFLATMVPPGTVRADANLVQPTDQGTGGLSGAAASAPATGPTPSMVSPNGSAHASYPFRLPRARGEAQPSLKLLYNSSNGVGFAGVGWTLNVPSIVRKGHAGLPRFTDPILNAPSGAGYVTTDLNTDDYYIDGKLLIPIRGGGGRTLPRL